MNLVDILERLKPGVLDRLVLTAWTKPVEIRGTGRAVVFDVEETATAVVLHVRPLTADDVAVVEDAQHGVVAVTCEDQGTGYDPVPLAWCGVMVRRQVPPHELTRCVAAPGHPGDHVPAPRL